jgi:hypothetical protein
MDERTTIAARPFAEARVHPRSRRGVIFGLAAGVLAPWCAPVQAGELEASFLDGSFGALERFLGPSDNPRDQRPEYTVVVENGRAVHLAPAAAPGPRLTGFLEPPTRLKPLPSDITIEWTLPDVRELQALASSGGIALAGHYIRGDYDFAARRGDWQGGMFGDWWGGAFKTGSTLLAVLRNGNSNPVAVPIRANTSIGFRMVKRGTSLALWIDEDGTGWREVGQATIGLNPGGKSTLAMSHFRVLDTSGGAVRVSVGRMRWSSPDQGWPK